MPIQPAAYGVASQHGGFLPDTALVIDDSIPPLFGYQPYGAGRPGETEGYVPYGAARPRGINMLTTRSSSKPPSQRFCRDFGRERQWELCDPAIFTQRLAVLPNKWFGVSSAREVTVVWPLSWIRHHLG